MRRFPRLKQPWMNHLCRMRLRSRFLTLRLRLLRRMRRFPRLKQQWMNLLCLMRLRSRFLT